MRTLTLPPTAACESQARARAALLPQRGKMGLGWSSRSLAELPGVPGTKQLLGSQREGVWPPTGPTCPPSRPLGPASVHLSLQYFLEPPGLCLCRFLCLLRPFPNFLSSSLLRAHASVCLGWPFVVDQWSSECDSYPVTRRWTLRLFLGYCR